MKKLLLLIIAATFVFALTACDGDGDEESRKAYTPVITEQF